MDERFPFTGHSRCEYYFSILMERCKKSRHAGWVGSTLLWSPHGGTGGGWPRYQLLQPFHPPCFNPSQQLSTIQLLTNFPPVG